MSNLKVDAITATPGDIGNGPDLIAIGLLKLQQRFEALDKLYNEEIGRLSRDLAQMKADYVRLYQTQSATPRKAKPSRSTGRRTTSMS